MDRLLNDAMKTRMTKPVNCPDAEQLAAWADGSIYGAAAEGIESHLADCDRCQAVIAAFVTSEPEVASAPVAPIPDIAPGTPHVTIPARRTPYVLWAGAAAAASLVMYFAWPKPAPAPVEVQSGTVARSEASPTPQATIQATPQASGAAPKATQTLTKAAPTEVRTLDSAKGQQQRAVDQTTRPAQTVAAVPPPAPPPPAIVTADTTRSAPPAGAAPIPGGLAAAESSTVSFLMALPNGGVEFGPTDPVASVTLTQTQQGAGAARANPLKAIRWRVLAGLVEKTIDGGATWSRIVLDPALSITSGASPSNVVCWLIGKRGTVLRSTDGGVTFTKVTPPATVDLVGINASDARNATVSTSDGRRLTTTDGGVTWH